MKSACMLSVQLNRFQVQSIGQSDVLLQILLAPLYALWTEINYVSIKLTCVDSFDHYHVWLDVFNKITKPELKL